MKIHIILLLIAVISGQSLWYQYVDDGWQFRMVGNESWYPANVPSTFHLDLLDNGLIPDPYYDLNQLEMYKFEDKDWEYQVNFTANKTRLTKQVQNLVFEGLDTHADVYLNGELILQANNMHRVWRIDVKGKLREENNLRIYFHSAVLLDLENERTHPIRVPVNYSYSRKSHYHYGWDWGPRLVTAGIWKDVMIESYDNAKIDSINVRTLKLNPDSADLSFVVDLTVNQPGTYQVVVKNEGQVLSTNSFMSILRAHQDSMSVTQELPYTMQNPRLWWPRGQGKQELYYFDFELYNGTDLVDSKTFRSGIRTIEWIQEGDSVNGTSFYAKVNGRPVYMKGGNYIPPDMFMPRAIKNPSVYFNTIQDAVDAGYNTIRVWGGGQFEYDLFYDLCDENGLMVWHDLMFACAFYYIDDAILNNIDQEIRDNINRIRRHPSIAMWNGNNEVWIGWREWGWQNGKSQEELTTMVGWYDQLFNQRIPAILSEIDPDKFYWPTSPSTSSGNYKTQEFKSGDIHFYGVWGACNDIEDYRLYVGRFNSEYGMQAMIDISSIRKFSNTDQWDIDSDTMKIHERHIAGWPTIKTYIKTYFKPPRNFESCTKYCYVLDVHSTQYLQSLSLETAITALRTAKPYNMGTLYWQLNDLWPVFSWASVDYYGCWKASHYTARKFHRDPIVTVKFNLTTGQNQFYIISDVPEPITGNVTIQLMAFSGKVLHQFQLQNVQTDSTQAKMILDVTLDQLHQLAGETFLNVKFIAEDSSLNFETNYVFERPLNLKIQKPNINVQINGGNISLTSDTFVKWLYIGHPNECLKLSDNYFDLLPGVTKHISLSTFNISNAEIYLHSLWDVSDKAALQDQVIKKSFNRVNQ